MKSAICSLSLRDVRRTASLAEGAEQTRGEAGRGDAQSPAVEAGARMVNAARQAIASNRIALNLHISRASESSSQWLFLINMATFWLSR